MTAERRCLGTHSQRNSSGSKFIHSGTWPRSVARGVLTGHGSRSPHQSLERDRAARSVAGPPRIQAKSLPKDLPPRRVRNKLVFFVRSALRTPCVDRSFMVSSSTHSHERPLARECNRGAFVTHCSRTFDGEFHGHPVRRSSHAIPGWCGSLLLTGLNSERSEG